MAINPDVIVLTKEAREICERILLSISLRQSANVGGLMVGLLRGDYDLIGKSLVDYIAEPHRSKLIPGFYEMKKPQSMLVLLVVLVVLGPSVFALCKGKEIADKVGIAMKNVMNHLENRF